MTSVALVAGCDGETSPSRPPAAYGGYGGPYPSPYSSAPYASAPPYAAPAPGPAPAPYGTPPIAAQPPASAPQPVIGPDPIELADPATLRSRAAALMTELEGVLPDVARARVTGLPLVIDDTPGLVNAFASCTTRGPVVVVTDTLLVISARLARARADDERLGTHEVDDYIAFVARNTRKDAPIPEPPPGLFDTRHGGDPARAQRIHDVYDEIVGFVVGHELAHHHLGHLPCTGGNGPFGTGELVRGLSSAVPLFNQPNELAADSAGVNTVLVAGARRSGYHLSEGGALLMMQFFSGIDRLSAIDVLFAFEATHPPPLVRIPVITESANLVRLGGSAIWLPILRL